MAKSGSIYGTTSNSAITAWISWSITNQDIETNTSTVRASIAYQRNDSYTTYGTWSGAISINGVNTTFTKEIEIDKDSYVYKATATVDVKHNNDGSKSIVIAANGSIPGTTLTNTTIRGTVSLDDIPRTATIISAPNFNDEGNPTIKYNNPAGSKVSALDACISLTGATDDIPYRAISKTGDSYTFNLTSAERATLRKATTDSNSRTVKFYIRTTYGDTVLRNSVSKTLTIVNGSPVLSPTAVDTNSATIALTGDNNKIVRYFSNVAVATNATAQKNSTIKSYKTTCGGSSITTASGTFTNVNTGKFEFSATDSRGNTTTSTLNKTLISYINLTSDIKGELNTDGLMTITASGNYFKGSFGVVNNTLTLEYRYKLNGGSWGDWISLTPNINEGSYSANTSISGLNYRNTYVIQARAVDKLRNITSAEYTVMSYPVFEWGADDFVFNVPVYITGDIILNGVSLKEKLGL